jgi:hypothetical protein
MGSLRVVQNFVDIRLKQEALARYGLPDIAYAIPANSLEQGVSAPGELPWAMLLYGLQQRSRDAGKDWKPFLTALDRLANLVAPDDSRGVITVSGDTWWLEVGPVDLNGKLVTVQRGDDLVAAIVPREDGRLRVATYLPLDAKSAEYLIELGQNPHPDGGVCMRENNWEYALDCSAGMGNHYAADQGEAYLSFWEKGIGVNWDGTDNPVYRPYKDQVPRRPALVATELGIHYASSADPEADVTPEEEEDKAPEQTEIPRWPSKRQQRRTVQGRFVGCLLGGAVGDALGAPVEFMKRTEILRRFGPNGITAYVPAYGGLGTITDDTQMALFTAEGLLRAWVRGCFKGITTFTGVTAHAYLRWLQTQGERSRCEVD